MFRIVLILCLLFPSCGYRFGSGKLFPPGIKYICFDILENPTSETSIDVVITNDLIRQFTINTDIVPTNRDSSDAVLSGKISSMKIRTISRTGALTATERRVTISVDLKLTKNDGTIVWSGKDITDSETYPVIDSDKYNTESNRRSAISKLSERLAETVYSRITNRF